MYLSRELLFSDTHPLLFSVNDTRPPPIIRIGPQSQNLPTGEVGFLHCEAYGDPKPQIWWLKDNRPMTENSRIISLSSGTLQISGTSVKKGKIDKYYWIIKLYELKTMTFLYVQ